MNPILERLTGRSSDQINQSDWRSFLFEEDRESAIPAALLIGVWFFIQLVSGGAVATVQTYGVAYLGHIGGIFLGVVFARLFEDSRRIAEQQWRR